MADQSNGYIKVQFGESTIFIGFTNKSMGKKLQEKGWLKCSSVSKKPSSNKGEGRLMKLYPRNILHDLQTTWQAK